MDSTLMIAWLGGLGLQASSRPGATGEEIGFGPVGATDQPAVIRWRTPGVMDMFHIRSMPASELTTQWRDPSNASTPGVVLREAVDHVARIFPLVEGAVSEADGAAVVYFSAVLFDEQLTRQAFALTVSSVLKAAAMFEAGSKVRAEQLAAVAAMQAHQAATNFAPPPAPPAATLQAQTWQPGNGAS